MSETELKAIQRDLATIKERQQRNGDLLDELSGKVDLLEETIKDEIDEAMKETQQKISEVRAYLSNIIEKNQHIIYKAIQGIEEEETKEPEDSTE